MSIPSSKLNKFREILEPEVSELEELMRSTFNNQEYYLNLPTHPTMVRMKEITTSSIWKDKMAKWEEEMKKITPPHKFHDQTV